MKVIERHGSRTSLRTDQDEEEKALRFDLPNMSMNESIANTTGKLTPVPKDLNLSVMSSLTTDSTVFYSPYSSRENTNYIEDQDPEPSINIKNLTSDCITSSPLRRPETLTGRVKGRPPIRSSSESLVTIEDDNERDEEQMDTSMISHPEEQHPSLVEKSEGKLTIEEQDVDDEEQMEVVRAKATVEEQQVEDAPEEPSQVTIEEQEIIEELPFLEEERTVTLEVDSSNEKVDSTEAIVSPTSTFEFKEPELAIAPVSINKINTTTFAPFVSSSKFCELEKADSARPISDKSTVIGCSTMFFQESFSTSTISSTTTKTTYYTALESQHALDTTVGMSGFECTQLGIPRELLDVHDEESCEPENSEEGEDEDEMNNYLNEIYEDDEERSSTPEVVCLDSSSGSGTKGEVFGEEDNGELLIISECKSCNF